MRWKYYRLANNDPKAKKHIFENLEIGAHEHMLTKKLLSRFSGATGSMLLIAFESLDLDAACLFQHATYSGGKDLRQLPEFRSITWMDCATWGLVPFLDKYLLQSTDAVVLCENPYWDRESTMDMEYPHESKVLYFADEVYHVLRHEDAHSADLIEATIREATAHWGAGVCSAYADVPQGDIPSEHFFDAIVTSTKHIFTPALDGEGYLVWSPK